MLQWKLDLDEVSLLTFCWAPPGCPPPTVLTSVIVTAEMTLGELLSEVEKQIGWKDCHLFSTVTEQVLSDQDKSLTDYSVSHNDILEVRPGVLEEC
jgi:hypothetical protein